MGLVLYSRIPPVAYRHFPRLPAMVDRIASDIEELMRHTKSLSERCVVRSPRTETQEANLHGSLSASHYFSCENSRAIENTPKLSPSNTSRELMARGVRPNFVGCETVESIVTSSSRFVSDTSFCIRHTDPRSKTLYPKSKAALGLLPVTFRHMKGSHAS
jgi:hypothetical protein